MNSIDQQFIEFIVKSLVGNPDGVHIDRRIDEKGVLLELTVDPDDLGRVIGKRGATAQSLRTLLRALGTKNDARYNLKIIDNGAPAPVSASDTQAQDAGTQDDDQAVQSTATQPAQQPLDDDLADDEADDQQPKPADTRSDSLASKTRRELEELDDLDV